MMPQERKKKIIEDSDHAFELALILVTIISGILAQYVPTQLEINLPPIIADMRRLSVVFIFPLILTILAWIIIYFTDNESWKMRLRTYAWSSIIFSVLLGVVEFYVICLSKHVEWIDYIFVLGPFLFGLFIPIIPILLMRQVLKRYKMALGTIDYFSEGRKIPILYLLKAPLASGTLRRWAPFFLSYIVFWLAFFLTTLV